MINIKLNQIKLLSLKPIFEYYNAYEIGHENLETFKFLPMS